MIPFALPWREGLHESWVLSRAFVDTIINKNDAGATTRVPMVQNGVDVVVFIVFTIFCLFFNWGMRLLIVQPIARAILHGPKKKVRLFAFVV